MCAKIKKKRLCFLILAEILLTAALVLAVIFGMDKATVTNLGNPCALDFDDEHYLSRAPADMMVYNGRLYVGAGDYDKNTGPIYVHSYDISSGEWERSASALPDEQIKRFVTIDGELYIAGTDPRDDWEKGNFYRYENGEFTTYRVLDGAVHNFDIVKFEDKLFFGLGVVGNSSPVVVFDGEDYLPVSFLKNGEPLDTSEYEIIRVYNFLVLDGKLYAFLSLGDESEALMDLYVYENGAFSHLFESLPSVDMTKTLELGDRAFLLMGYNLFATADLSSFESVPLGAPVVDVYPYGNGFCVLCAAKKDASAITNKESAKTKGGISTESEISYINTIFITTDGENYEEIVSFETPILAGSLAYDEESGTFFASLGAYGSALSADVGKILQIKP